MGIGHSWHLGLGPLLAIREKEKKYAVDTTPRGYIPSISGIAVITQPLEEAVTFTLEIS